MTDVRPDDVPRSPTGRVPNWVIDEASGRTPRDLVPFRAPAATAAAPRTRDSRGGTAFRVVLALAVVLGLLALGRVVGGPSQYGGTSLTAQTHRDWPLPGHEEAHHPLGTPQPVVVPSTAYAFAMRQDDGKTPVTWSPCRPVHYVVRPDNAPPGGDQLLANGFAQLHAATGLRFVDDGPTDEAPTSGRHAYQKARYGDHWAPVLVTWANDTEVPDFGTDIVGKAGAASVRTRSGDLTYVTGEVSFDAAALADMIRQHHEAQAQLVILHELGHLAGLDHVSDMHQVMWPKDTVDASNYQPGDLAGLNALGSGPCQPDI